MRRFQRMLTIAVLLGTLSLTSGCGTTFRESVRNGVFTYVSGSLSSGLISTQIGSYINDLLLEGFQNPE